MKYLALEFSTLRRSAALIEFAEGKSSITASATEEARRGGSPFPLIGRVLGEHLPEAILIGLGPGSYTGIRSALAIAQGWNLAHGTPAAGISSADAIATEAWNLGLRGAVEVCIDAQRNEVYSSCYELSDGGVHVTEPLMVLSAPRGKGLLVGPDAIRWNSNGKEVFPTGAALVTFIGKAAFGPSENLEPIYLREPSFRKAPAIRHA